MRRGDTEKEGAWRIQLRVKPKKELVEIGRVMVCCPPNAQISEKMRRNEG